MALFEPKKKTAIFFQIVLNKVGRKMNNIIGIDSGSSTVKLIEVDENGKILHKLILNKMPVKKAIEIFINRQRILKCDVDKIVITGVGKDEFEGNIYGIPTIKVDEFTAIGAGGLYLTKKKNGLVVSIGTGTAFVEAKNKSFKHIGGTGVGGGTLLNLCKKIGGTNSFKDINEAILKGSLENVDLTIQDVAINEIETLPKDTTSANFGKLNENASKNDMILGMANMIFETIGMMAVFATRNQKNRNIIIIGNVAAMPYINKVLNKIENIHKGIKFIIPKHAEFGAAIGAIEATK